MKITRKDFLRIAGFSVAGAGAAKAVQVLGAADRGPQSSGAGKRWGMVIDFQKCRPGVDCDDCLNACRLAHNIPEIPERDREVKWVWKERYEKVFPFQQTDYTRRAYEGHVLPVLCNHCAQPACVRVCPTAATWKRDDGVVMMDQHRCIGCRYCMAACPYGSRSFNWSDPRPYIHNLKSDFPTRTKGVVEKCNFCEERLAEGRAPACVEACRQKAIVFGDLNDEQSTVRQLLRARYAVQRMPELGTGPFGFLFGLTAMFMLEKAMVGSRRYWGWLAFLLLLIALAGACYLRQLRVGLAITGLSRDVTWGLYIAQFTFFVGVAASAVMVVLPYYLHDVKAFHKITILGEFLAVSAVTMCMLFILVDMGQPARVLNVLRYPTLSSVMFWDMVSLGGYLLLNGVISIVMLSSERNGVPAPRWIRPVIVLSIPWAVSIHTVTAFLYSGLPGRTFWMTAILAPRFLASAFASGPALLILLCLLLRRLTSFDAGKDAIRKLGVIVAYAMSLSVFFVLLELFTVFYSRIPEEMEHFRFLFVGLDGDRHLAPWMWISAVTGIVALVLLLVPKLRNNETMLAVAALLVFVSLWIEKGLGLIVGGFVPSPLGSVTRYSPTAPEWLIVLGVWAIGALLITVFYKITVSVREVR